jgi:hypothetical protein
MEAVEKLVAKSFVGTDRYGPEPSSRVTRELTGSAPEWPGVTYTPINTPRSRNVTPGKPKRRKT